MKDKNIIELNTFKYNVTKISLFLAALIAFVFFILRMFNIIPRDSIATANTTALLFFLIFMFICLIKFKKKIFIIQIITYFVIITFIGIQTILAKYHIFLPVWIDFTILTAYIATDRKVALIISLYGVFVLIFLKLSHYYTIDNFSFLTLLMSLIAFSILGYLISIQLDKYAKQTLLQKEKLEKLALIDELTGIFNRRAFLKIGNKLLKQAIRTKKNISIIMMDIDYFKKVNDTYGHKAGDLVLKNFVKNIKEIIRENDIFARIGGEEFIIFLYDINPDDSKKIAEKILNKIRNTEVKINNKNTINITVSIGVLEIGGKKLKEDITIENLMIKSDRALYKAKERGRNRIEDEML